MASWHQNRSPVKRWHTTKWSVWDDPPNEPAGVAVFNTKEQAEEYKANCERHGRKYIYIYAPAPNGR